jgi:hypothetical protein
MPRSAVERQTVLVRILGRTKWSTARRRTFVDPVLIEGILDLARKYEDANQRQSAPKARQG